MTSSGAPSLLDGIWARDESLWGGPGVPEIADRLGWLDIADRMLPLVHEIEAWAEEVRADGLTNVVLLGMGGSSLGPEVLSRSFGGSLTMLDSTDPSAVAGTVDDSDLARTVFVVSSKSGGTIETMSHFKYFHARCGGSGAQFCAVTDPGSPLEALAAESGFRKIWLADPQIGGRFSVLSVFGLVPAALAGVPLTGLLERAVAAAEDCRRRDGNPGLTLGRRIGEAALAGRDKLSLIVDPPLESFGLWAEQLIAESTGKHGRGVLPVIDEPAAAPESYGEDRLFLHIACGDPDTGNAEFATRLEESGQPVLRIDAAGAEDLGRLMFVFEFAVAVIGHLLGINPFDQPNVQESKDATARVLGSGASEPALDGEGSLAVLIAGAAPPDYFALMGYLAPDDDFEAAIDDLRRVLCARTGAATTFGYGPRFLHSTGQLHKGGPPGGRFVQLLHDAGPEVPIPGESYGFRALKHAQAAGDFEALRSQGRQVVRLGLDGDPAAAVRAMTAGLA